MPIVRDRMRAEDVVQEAFIKLTPQSEAGAPVEQPLGYLYRIVRNLALDLVRRRLVERRHQTEETAEWLKPEETPTPEQEILAREDMRRIAEALANLPERSRIALQMHRLGDCTLQQIADRLGVSVATAHRLVRDAIVQITLALDTEKNEGA